MADDKVVELPIITKLHIPPDRILTKAVGKLDNLVVVGWDKEGEFYFASSEPDGAEVLWLLELAKQRLFEMRDADA